MSRSSRAALTYTVFTVALFGLALPGVLVVDEVGSLDPPWRAWPLVVVAAALGGGGVALVAGGARQLAARGVRLLGTAPPAVLVTEGWYSRVRNPIDIGVCAIALALWAAVDIALMWVVPAGTIIYFAAGVGPYEDRRLLEEFDDDFRAYSRAVGKWLPR